ncbi:MAG: hypothetical protein VB070_10950 [Clostridiaceae bacterium]|nr:hypothetical protein [Clostridiaceae bacterium]
MNIKPAFRYQMKSYLKGGITIYLILMAIIAALLIGLINVRSSTATTVSFSGISITTAIFLFVTGIVNIRSDLRLCLQYGVSRRTSYISELLVIGSISAVLAAAGELLSGVIQLITAHDQQFLMSDLYQLIFLGSEKTTLNFSQHILSALINVGLMSAACLFGMFFSLMFWRLNKFWTVVAALSIPVLLNVVPILISVSGLDLKPFLKWVVSSPFCLILSFILMAAFFGIINWLMLRKANIREAN